MHWLELIYYFLCAILFSISLSLTTSVLNMLARDTRKLILACMRLLMYLTPILWDIKMLPHTLQVIMKLNPIYYLVCGYKDCFFYHEGYFILLEADAGVLDMDDRLILGRKYYYV